MTPAELRVLAQKCASASQRVIDVVMHRKPGLSLMEIPARPQKDVDCILAEASTALLACAEREENAHDLAGAYWRLEKYGFVCTHNADDPEHEAEAEHCKSIEIAAAKEKP